MNVPQTFYFFRKESLDVRVFTETTGVILNSLHLYVPPIGMLCMEAPPMLAIQWCYRKANPQCVVLQRDVIVSLQNLLIGRRA